MASIKLEHLQKTFPNGHAAVRGINLEIGDGEFVVLVGPSGCGKSTVLRMVSGLEPPSGGRISIGDEDVTHLPPQQRDVAMVFQNYALYPHKTVRDNLAFGLRMLGASRDRIAERVQRIATTLELVDALDRKPNQLSGGQRQRVAIGRAIVREAKAFLLDEPLSNLDARLRAEMRAELARLHRQLGATMLYVTHDQEEAMTLGDRIAVMREGQFEQVGTPLEVYTRPANTFVGGFIGSPAMNFFRARPQRSGGASWLESTEFPIKLDAEFNSAFEEESAIIVGIRPQDVRLANAGAADTTARVEVVERMGRETLIHLSVAGRDGSSRLTLIAPPETAVHVDQRVGLRFDRDRLHFFSSQRGERLD